MAFKRSGVRIPSGPPNSCIAPGWLDRATVGDPTFRLYLDQFSRQVGLTDGMIAHQHHQHPIRVFTPLATTARGFGGAISHLNWLLGSAPEPRVPLFGDVHRHGDHAEQQPGGQQAQADPVAPVSDHGRVRR